MLARHKLWLRNAHFQHTEHAILLQTLQLGYLCIVRVKKPNALQTFFSIDICTLQDISLLFFIIFLVLCRILDCSCCAVLKLFDASLPDSVIIACTSCNDSRGKVGIPIT